jgi:hypothetical protein
MLGAKCWEAKVLLPEAAGPQRTRMVLRGTVISSGETLRALSIAMLSLLWYNARAYVYQAPNQDALYMMFTRILQYLLGVQDMIAAAFY